MTRKQLAVVSATSEPELRKSKTLNWHLHRVLIWLDRTVSHFKCLNAYEDNSRHIIIQAPSSRMTPTAVAPMAERTEDTTPKILKVAQNNDIVHEDVDAEGEDDGEDDATAEGGVGEYISPTLNLKLIKGTQKRKWAKGRRRRRRRNPRRRNQSSLIHLESV